MLDIINVSKSYGENKVLKKVSFHLDNGGSSDGIYCLMAPSGAGKTTLFRLILGLEAMDGGSVSTDLGEHPFSVVFQEDRLCEDFSPLRNIRLACRKTLSEEEIRSEMTAILPAECADRPVKTLSGGMKRRVSILRAVLAPSKAILMDEPFSGLDEELRRTVIDYILKKREGRLLIVATHQQEDVDLLGAELLTLPGFQASQASFRT